MFKNKAWLKKINKRSKGAIGRIGVVSPKDSERYHLKLILNRSKGAQSFEQLRTHEGTIYAAYKEAAYAIGLIENDKNIFETFEEACSITLPQQLRIYFINFLIAENIQGNTI